MEKMVVYNSPILSNCKNSEASRISKNGFHSNHLWWIVVGDQWRILQAVGGSRGWFFEEARGLAGLAFGAPMFWYVALYVTLRDKTMYRVGMCIWLANLYMDVSKNRNTPKWMSRQGGCLVKSWVFLDFLGSICSPTKGVEQKHWQKWQSSCLEFMVTCNDALLRGRKLGKSLGIFPYTRAAPLNLVFFF